jgi:hypothetical protein
MPTSVDYYIYCRKFLKLLVDGGIPLLLLKRKMFSHGEGVLVDNWVMVR